MTKSILKTLQLSSLEAKSDMAMQFIFSPLSCTQQKGQRDDVTWSQANRWCTEWHPMTMVVLPPRHRPPVQSQLMALPRASPPFAKGQHLEQGTGGEHNKSAFQTSAEFFNINVGHVRLHTLEKTTMGNVTNEHGCNIVHPQCLGCFLCKIVIASGDVTMGRFQLKLTEEPGKSVKVAHPC